jgi:hypothetical protein
MNAIAKPGEAFVFNEPDDVEWRYVNQSSGFIKDIANAHDNQENYVLEAFIKGTAPNATVEDDQPVKIAPAFTDESAFSP